MTISRTLQIAPFLVGLALVSGVALAKLPAAPPVDPAKAEEAKAKAAEAAKKESELMTKYQDKAVERYAAELKVKGKELKPYVAPVAPTPAAAPAAASPAPAAAPVAAATPPAPVK